MQKDSTAKDSFDLFSGLFVHNRFAWEEVGILLVIPYATVSNFLWSNKRCLNWWLPDAADELGDGLQEGQAETAGEGKWGAGS